MKMKRVVVSVAMAAGMAFAAGAAGLPSNYVEVGYVESTKGAYIDTGVKATGTGAPVTLTDEEPPADKAFYRVEVSAL